MGVDRRNHPFATGLPPGRLFVAQSVWVKHFGEPGRVGAENSSVLNVKREL